MLAKHSIRKTYCLSVGVDANHLSCLRRDEMHVRAVTAPHVEHSRPWFDTLRYKLRLRTVVGSGLHLLPVVCARPRVFVEPDEILRRKRGTPAAQPPQEVHDSEPGGLRAYVLVMRVEHRSVWARPQGMLTGCPFLSPARPALMAGAPG